MHSTFGVTGPILALALTASAAAAASGRHLPLSGNLDDPAMIQSALKMNTVQNAIAKCEHRGYLRHPEADAVVQSQSPATAAVYLAFEKPGLALPPDQVGAPLVIVTTTLSPSGRPRTKVVGTLVIADLKGKRLSSADQDPALAATDPSFEVTETTIDDAVEVGTTTTTTTYSVAGKIAEFLSCVGWGAWACMVQVIDVPTPIPAVVVTRVLVCTAIVALACFTKIF